MSDYRGLELPIVVILFLSYDNLLSIPMMNKLAIFSAIAGSAVLMTGIITGLQLLQIQEASAATNNCSRNVVGACVATDDVARNALRNSQVCVNVNVIAENNPGCRR